MSVETALCYPALSYPAVGFNPAPGATERVRSLAAELRSVATELGAAHQALVGIGRSSGSWQGEAAQAFHDKLGELPDYLDQANRSLGDAATTLNQWSADLASMHTAAAQYEAEAAQALQQLRAAESNPDLQLGGQVCSDDTSLAQAQARYDLAVSQVDNAAKELEEIRGLARRLRVQHEELVSEVTNALRRATDEAPQEPGLLEGICGFIGTIVTGVEHLASATWRWAKDHADLIAQIGGLLSKVGAVLGVLAIITAPFEPVGAIFAGTAAVTSLMALGAHGLAKAAGGHVGWSSMVGDALGALPFIGGVARGAKTVAMIRGEAVLGRLDTGFEAAYQNVREGALLGTKGLNPIIHKLGGTGIDPLSVGGRTLDAGIKAGGEISKQVYHDLAGSDGPPPSASATFRCRVAARGAA